MNIGIFGTGGVAQTLGARLAELGHTVMLGTRSVADSLARTQPDAMGSPPLQVWHAEHPEIRLGTFAEAAAHGALLLNATNGLGALPALRAARSSQDPGSLDLGSDTHLDGKTLLDISNPLDFSKGFPPSLFVSNTDSLAEQIQREFPSLKVVKSLNTTNNRVMAYPRQLADGDHTMFVAGNDPAAKAQVVDLLTNGFGWRDVIDLGDLTAARGLEMFLPLWVRLFGVLQTPAYNIKVVR
jgi:predicted dinucleotide-binding enzyme